ncbi:hypothetical protein NECAME_10476 [Necator americanus]|uniref:Uncharacterized protein n=1 Tax=Necator americanus TaxID=51031 RepID=W2T9N3_NECAM|nr:hypothetical protein NECAME_10476 [Necator americanus]ETN78279.1 hypothetical protein NECAME_10476 [Necator americanus]
MESGFDDDEFQHKSKPHKTGTAETGFLRRFCGDRGVFAAQPPPTTIDSGPRRFTITYWMNA